MKATRNTGFEVRSLHARGGAQLAVIAIAPVAALLLGGATQGANQDQVYVLSNLYIAAYPDDKACPKLSLSALDIMLQNLPPAEREKYANAENERSLSRLMFQKYGFKDGPSGGKPGRNGAAPTFTDAQIEALRNQLGIAPGKGKLTYLGLRFSYNLCTDPEDFPDFAVGNAPYMGQVAFGIDLDGKTGKNDFTSPDGAKGVDNALIGATGCNRTTRDYGDPQVADNIITSLASPTLMRVQGIDDAMNDDDVTVEFYASGSPRDLTGTGKALPWGSLDIDPDPRFHAKAKARIVNGELITEPFDVRFRMREQIIDSYREIRGARLKAKLGDGSAIQGSLYGYHTLESMFQPYHQTGTVGLNLMSCPASARAIRQWADGYPDPATGKNTAISAALNFRGVPAFAVEPQAKVASSQ